MKVDVISKGRGEGKTSELVLLSAKTGIPILCANPPYVMDRAEELGVEIPPPIWFLDLKRHRLADVPEEVYVDELPYIFQRLAGISLRGFTITPDD